VCGICGIININEISPDLVHDMTKTLAHRGPDDEGVFTDGRLGMGARRLAIIDIEGGVQPFTSEDGRFTLIYNGEVFNHEALRKELESRGHSFRSRCDTEVVLHVLEESPLDGVNRFRGIFAFALWDRAERTLILGRDRLGVKPLYYYFRRGLFAFASEIKALIEVPEISRDLRPDFDALNQILTYNFPLGMRTAFDGINELPPGHILVWRGDRVRMKQYWDVYVPPAGEEDLPDEGEAAHELIELLRESVRMRLMSDVPLGMFLSGGADSSLIAACALEAAGGGLPTFALSFDVPLWDESEKARSVAKYLGADHREIPCAPGLGILPRVVAHLEQPQRWSGAAAIYQLYEAARRDVKVILTGEGADEIFGGYPHLTEFPLRLRAEPGRHPINIYLSGLSYMDEHKRSLLYSPEFAGKINCDARETSHEFLINTSRLAGRDPFNMGLYLDIKLRMVKFVTFMLDRLSMAHGVEARVPFLDHVFVERAMRLHSSLKVRPPLSKYILRRAGDGLLPREVLERPKQGFIEPVDYWMRAELPPCIRHALDPQVIRRKGYFKPQAVSDMLERHRAGAADHGYDLVGAALVHIWDDMFMVGKSIAEMEAGE